MKIMKLILDIKALPMEELAHDWVVINSDGKL